MQLLNQVEALEAALIQMIKSKDLGERSSRANFIFQGGPGAAGYVLLRCEGGVLGTGKTSVARQITKVLHTAGIVSREVFIAPKDLTGVLQPPLMHYDSSAATYYAAQLTITTTRRRK